MARKKVYGGDLISEMWGGASGQLNNRIYSALELDLTFTDSTADWAKIRQKVTSCNEAGGMEFWFMPPIVERYYNIYSPMMCKVAICKFVFNEADVPAGKVGYAASFSSPFNTYTIYYYVDDSVSDTISLYVFSEAGAKVATLKAETFGGVASFNVSPIAQSLLGNGIQENNIHDDYVLIEEPMLYVLFGVNYADEAPDTLYFAVNGVNDAGHDNGGLYIGTGETKVLTRPQELINWVTQEEDGEALPCPNGFPEVTIITNGTSRYVARVRIGSLFTFNTYGLGALGFTYAERDIMECSPMLIRWLNEKGGMEQKVFMRHQFRQQSSKTNGLREVYSEGLNGDNINGRVYAIDTEDTMTLGEENLVKQEYERLMTMPTSPFIEWLDVRHEVFVDSGIGDRFILRFPYWHAVSVNKYEGTRDYGAKAHTFEITINMPKRDTQFG